MLSAVARRYLEKNLKSFQPPPASIVELGSGNGLVGMVCALFFGNPAAASACMRVVCEFDLTYLSCLFCVRTQTKPRWW
jgi:hypothetical protein